jgi:hypothetical protein
MRADNHKEKKKIKASDNAIEERDGMRMGYHSEKGITDDDEKGDGMRMGYHSEKGITDDDEKGDGMRMGYHSEKVNPGKHSKRLHKKQE